MSAPATQQGVGNSAAFQHDVAIALWAVIQTGGENRRRTRLRGASAWQAAPWLEVWYHRTPTAREINKMIIVSEIKIWIIAKTFAQRASNGASVGPKVELCVKATKT